MNDIGSSHTNHCVGSACDFALLGWSFLQVEFTAAVTVAIVATAVLCPASAALCSWLDTAPRGTAPTAPEKAPVKLLTPLANGAAAAAAAAAAACSQRVCCGTNHG